MTAQSIGRILGPSFFAITAFFAPPAGMPAEAWLVAGLVVWMATWWMTEAVPLTATALLPFVVLPFAGVSSAKEVASTYYSPILLGDFEGGRIKRRANAPVAGLHDISRSAFDVDFQHIDFADHDANGASCS